LHYTRVNNKQSLVHVQYHKPKKIQAGGLKNKAPSFAYILHHFACYDGDKIFVMEQAATKLYSYSKKYSEMDEENLIQYTIESKTREKMLDEYCEAIGAKIRKEFPPFLTCLSNFFYF